MSTFNKIREDAVREAVRVGVVGGLVPLADPVGMAAVCGRAIFRLADLHDRRLDFDSAVKMSLAVLTTLAAYATSVKVFQTALYLLGPLSIPLNMGISSVLDALIAARMCRIANRILSVKKIEESDFTEIAYTLVAIPSLGELKDLIDLMS